MLLSIVINSLHTMPRTGSVKWGLDCEARNGSIQKQSDKVHTSLLSKFESLFTLFRSLRLTPSWLSSCLYGASAAGNLYFSKTIDAAKNIRKERNFGIAPKTAKYVLNLLLS